MFTFDVCRFCLGEKYQIQNEGSRSDSFPNSILFLEFSTFYSNFLSNFIGLNTRAFCLVVRSGEPESFFSLFSPWLRQFPKTFLCFITKSSYGQIELHNFNHRYCGCGINFFIKSCSCCKRICIWSLSTFYTFLIWN